MAPNQPYTPEQLRRILHRLYTGSALSLIERRALAEIVEVRLHHVQTRSALVVPHETAQHRSSDERRQAENLAQSQQEGQANE